MLRLVVADDHPVMLDGLVAYLNSFADVDVVAAVSDGEQAVSVAALLEADVAVLDLDMPVLDGFGAARRMARLHPAPAVVLVTGLPVEALEDEAKRCGVSAVVSKTAASWHLACAVQNLQPR